LELEEKHLIQINMIEENLSSRQALALEIYTKEKEKLETALAKERAKEEEIRRLANMKYKRRELK